MKIYFAFDEEKFNNPFVSILANRLKEEDSSLEIVSGIDVFWNDEIFSCDIIHIHWPEIVIREANKPPQELRERLKDIKNRGGKIVATCHNISAHYAKFSWQKEAYSIVYAACDLILHMGNYSLNLFKEMYPSCRNEILPHHIYDDRYKEIYSKDFAAKKLGLSSKNTYILCLGAFRDTQERSLLLGLSKFLKKNSIKILAPSFYIAPRPNRPKKIIRFIKFRLKALQLNLLHNIKTCLRPISEEEVPLFGAVADEVFLQRVAILNSGNLPLGFYLGKVVVGPNMGNVGEQLIATGNPTFNVDQLDSLPQAIEKGLELAKSGFGSTNKDFAIQNLSSKKIAQQLLQYYKQIL